LPVAVVFLLRAVVLILLWGFVVAAVVAVRNDIFGAKPKKVRPPKPARPAPAPKPPAATAPKRSRASSRATPTRLAVVGGPKQGTSVALSSLPVTIGRAKDSTVVIDDDYASTNHARLVPSGKTWMLEDLGSTNGTLLGSSKVTAPVAVKVGDRITIGRSVLEVQA
jgi:pSer/pThr/pTyr-binding forkhead associated (FHA) protein